MTFDIITSNLEDYVKTYSIEVEQIKEKSTNFLFGDIYTYKDNNFIGITHSGWGYEIIVRPRYLKHWYSLSWKDLWSNPNSVMLYDTWAYVNNDYYDFYRIAFIVYWHLYQTTQNYRVVYSINDFRNNDCSYIGSYDGANCYVGTPPSGTTAFMYPDNKGAFYYTALPGNQCPYPGSWFDGANCYAIDIPSACDGFIYNNSWYVKTDLVF
jgi:hypothetical protein